METRQLKYFLDVANCLNFTKAAQQNHIAQTAMSQNIISLENQLGFKLFNRNNRNVSLTYMGEQFHREAVSILRAAERAERRMANLVSGDEGIIRIGFQGEHERGFLPGLVRSFRAKYPNVTVELEQAISSSLEQMLDAGDVDLIFNIQFQEKSEGTRELVVDSQQLCAVVPAGHPLAGLGRIPRSMLSEEPMVFLAPSCGQDIYHYMVHDSLRSGFVPNVVGYATSIYALLMMVACEVGISVQPKSCDTGQHQVVFLDLEEVDYINIAARWKPDNDNPPLSLLTQLLPEFFALEDVPPDLR